MAKFKVGDRVRISFLNDNHSEDWLKLDNETGKVTIVIEDFKPAPASYKIQLDKPLIIEREDYTFTHKNVILSETELLPIKEDNNPKSPKFKVGDRVLYSKSTVMPVFFEAVITEVDKTWYRVEYTDNNGDVQNEKCTEDEISIVATPKFSPMNTVTVIDNNSPYYGMSGTVKNFDSYQNAIYYDIILDYVYFKNGCTLTRRQYFTDDQLKNWENKDQGILASKEDNKSKPIRTKFNPGDLVKVAVSDAGEQFKNVVGRVLNIRIDNNPYQRIDNITYELFFDNKDLDNCAVYFNEADLLPLSNEPKFHVGDTVEFNLFNKNLVGQIIMIKSPSEPDDEKIFFTYLVDVCERDGEACRFVIFEPEEDLDYYKIKVKEPKFDISVDNRVLVTPDGKEVVMEELLSESSEEESYDHKYNIGDLVYIDSTTDIFTTHAVGKISEITKDNDNDEERIMYKLFFNNELLDRRPSYYDERLLKLLPTEPKFMNGTNVHIITSPLLSGVISKTTFEPGAGIFKYEITCVDDPEPGRATTYFRLEEDLMSEDEYADSYEFKVDDLVSVESDKYSLNHEHAVGKITEIKTWGSHTVCSIFFNEDILDKDNLQFNVSDLKPVIKRKPIFEVGDKAKVIGSNKIVTIDRIYTSGDTFEMECANDKRTRIDRICEDDLKPIFDIGDKVQVQNYNREYNGLIGTIDRMSDTSHSGVSGPSIRYGVVFDNNKVLPRILTAKYLKKVDEKPASKEVAVKDPDTFYLFVSQPMSGLEMDQIMKARQSAIATFINLYELSYNIDPDLNLVVIDNIQEEFTKQCEAEGRTPHSLEYLGNDIKMLKDADAIIFAKGWEKSKGCFVEFIVAQHNNISMYFE